MLRITLEICTEFNENNNPVDKETAIFVHGPKLWRLQKTTILNGSSESETIDFTEDEFSGLFPALYAKAKKVLESDEPQQRNLVYSYPYKEDIRLDDQELTEDQFTFIDSILNNKKSADWDLLPSEMVGQWIDRQTIEEESGITDPYKVAGIVRELLGLGFIKVDEDVEEFGVTERGGSAWRKYDDWK